jgi:hypothetical protein
MIFFEELNSAIDNSLHFNFNIENFLAFIIKIIFLKKFIDNNFIIKK